MADSVASILADIASSIKAGGDLNNVLEDLAENQKKAFDTTDPVKYQQTLAKLEKQVEELNKAEKEYNKTKEVAEEQLKDGNEEYDKTIKKLNRLEKVKNKAHVNLKKNMQEQAKTMNAAHQRMIEYNETSREHWKQNTRLGSAYSAITGPLSKMTAGFVAGTMALKAFNNWVGAARLKQDLLIKSFRDFDGSRTAENYIDTGKAIMETEEALRSARASAIRFGQDAEAVGGYMTQFQKIAGTDNVAALGKLTEATMAAARVTGTDMPTAMKFVQDRIDKFGGSASGAIMAMGEMRTTAERINEAFGDTVIRVDDVIGAVNEVTASSNIYAIDQDFVTKAISKNMMTLRTQGESYDYAKDRAMDYIKAVTTEAPEFMQIRAGQKLKGVFQDSINAGDFMDKFGKDLDKAKPGLSKKVKDVLGDETLDAFTKGQLIQQMTAGTEVGINVMNDQLLEMAKKGKQGVQVIKQLYNVDEQGAMALIDQARARKKEQTDLIKLQSASYDEAKKILEMEKSGIHISKQQFESAKGNKDHMQSLMDISKKHLLVKEEAARREAESSTSVEMINKAKAEIGLLEEQKKKSKAGSVEREIFEEQIRNQQQVIADASKKLKGEDLKQLEGFTKEITEKLQATNDASGTSFKAMIEEYSSIANLAMTGGALFLFKRSFDKMLNSFLNRFEKMLMKMSGIDGGGGGGGYGDGGGYGSDRHKKTRKNRKNRVRRGRRRQRFGRKFSGLKRGLKGGALGTLMNASMFADDIGSMGSGLLDKGKGLLGKGKGLLKGGKGLAKGGLKMGLKASRSIPVLGSLVSAGFAAENLWDIGKGLVTGKGVQGGDLARLGANIGGFLDPTGLVAAADTAAELTGAYDSMGTIGGNSGVAKGTAGDVVKALKPATGSSASAGGAPSSAGSGVLAASGMQQIGDEILFKIPAGPLAAAMGSMLNKTAKA